MVSVRASQKLFTVAESGNLSGICVDHLHSFAKGRQLGFIVSAAEKAGIHADKWLFTPWDLTGELITSELPLPRNLPGWNTAQTKLPCEFRVRSRCDVRTHQVTETLNS